MNNTKNNFLKRLKVHVCAKLLAFVLLCSTVFLPFSYTYAALSCSVTTAGACSGVVLLRMSGNTNAHAELPGQTNPNYGNAVVCCSSPSAIGNSCSGNFQTISRLSGITNAHAQETSVNTYGASACLSDTSPGDTVTVGYQNANCTGYDTTLFSLSSTTNATIGDGNAYTRKVCGTITSTIVTPPTTGSGGTSGSGVLTGVIFSGYAYPNATVNIWKNGSPLTTTTSNDTGYFTIKLDEDYTPSTLYTLYAEDSLQRRSLLLNYPVAIKTGALTRVTNILFPPTLVIDKTQAKESDSLTVSGYAIPNKSLSVIIEGSQSKQITTTSSSEGTYQFAVPLTGLPKGNYTIYLQYTDDIKGSTVIAFTIANSTVPTTDTTVSLLGDCNADEVINLVDFSVMAFWYGKDNPPKCVDTNNDGIINLVDFSILAFYWNE